MSKKKEAVAEFVYKVSIEGLAYALQNYFPSDDCPTDLYNAAADACHALDAVEAKLEKYMEKYDLEYS